MVTDADRSGSELSAARVSIVGGNLEISRKGGRSCNFSKFRFWNICLIGSVRMGLPVQAAVACLMFWS